jgi:WD40 repeat protein
MGDNAENEPVQQVAAAAAPGAADDAKKSNVPLIRSLRAELVFGKSIAPPTGQDASFSNQKTSMGHEVFCVRYSPDGQFIAASRGDGNIDVYSTGNGNKVYHLANVGDGSPTCSIRFRPNSETSKARNILTSASASGEVKHWHMTSMKCLHTISEAPNQVFALDYRRDGLKFATAGQDYALRLYDESTKSLQARPQTALRDTKPLTGFRRAR